MRKLSSWMSVLLVLLLVLAGGCSKPTNSTPAGEVEQQVKQPSPIEQSPSVPDQETTPGEEQTAVPPAVEINPDPIEEDDPEIPVYDTVESHFDLMAINKEDLSNGILTTLDFQVGTPFADVIALWGEPADEGYYGGGRYYVYASEKYTYLLFDPEIYEDVHHIHVYPNEEISLDVIRQLLGDPDAEELEFDDESNWLMVYRFEAFTVYAKGNGPESDSTIQYVFLKNEQ